VTVPLIGAVRGLANGWRDEAERRRRISRADPVAEALDYCAGELDSELTELESSTATVTVSVEEYAAATGVTPQTVRNWIRSGKLRAMRSAKGYRIARDAAHDGAGAEDTQ